MKSVSAAVLRLAALALSGCASFQPGKPLPTAGKRPTLTQERALPKQSQGKSPPFPHSQFVLLGSENFVETLSPIPFGADLVTDELHANRARDFEAKYRDVHPYYIAEAALQGSPLLSRDSAGYVLNPLVFLQQCSADRYRLAYVFYVEKGDWLGRYVYHLPTTYAANEITGPTPAILASLQGELTDGAAILRGLLAREAAGRPPATGAEAKVGNLHLNGFRALGPIGHFAHGDQGISGRQGDPGLCYRANPRRHDAGNERRWPLLLRALDAPRLAQYLPETLILSSTASLP